MGFKEDNYWKKFNEIAYNRRASNITIKGPIMNCLRRLLEQLMKTNELEKNKGTSSGSVLCYMSTGTHDSSSRDPHTW